MSYLLHLDSSSLTAASISRQVAASFLTGFDGDVVHRDLAATPAPHLTAAGISARLTAPPDRTPEPAEAAAVQDELIEEFLGAAGYLFTVPMYNYAMPSAFKAWLDQIVVVGRTIALPDGSPAAGRPALVISSRGGAYGPGTPNEGRDYLIPTLEFLLGPRNLGLQVTTLTPELALAPVVPQMAELIGRHEASVAAAHSQARELGARWPAPAAVSNRLT